MVFYKNKADNIREQLLAQIKNGYFRRGDVLPPERQLAADFGVSYMTARKAISDLVAANYLERRGRKGTLVREDLALDKANRTVAIIVSPYSAADMEEFVLRMSELSSRHNWLPKILYAIDYTDRVLEDAINNCNAVICFSLGNLQTFPGKNFDIINQRKIPFVLIGSNGVPYGLDSVCSPDPSAMNLAIDTLQKFGHERIALAYQNIGDPSSPAALERALYIQKMQLDRDFMRQSELLLQFDLPQFGNAQQELYELLLTRYRGKKQLPFSAIIIPLSYVQGALAAFYDLGFRVPEDVSIIVTGDRSEVKFYRPRLDMVKLSLHAHAQEAWQIMDWRLMNLDHSAAVCRFVQPELVPGETIRRMSKVTEIKFSPTNINIK